MLRLFEGRVEIYFSLRNMTRNILILYLEALLFNKRRYINRKLPYKSQPTLIFVTLHLQHNF